MNDPPPPDRVITGGAIATMDPLGTELRTGHVAMSGSWITAVGPGPAPEWMLAGPGVDVVDATDCLVTPGLVNTHHHLYQWLTRGLAQQADLFAWLRTLYPVWSGIDEESVHAAARAALAALARSGCTTTTDHHYVFPTGSGDLLAATVAAAGEVGLRFHPGRGAMDLGASAGGLPPDPLVESLDDILTETEHAIARYHDPGPEAMLRIAVAPCSPFSVTEELLVASAALARRHGVRLHTHLAETEAEDAYCRERYGCSPTAYLDRLNWLADDVWVAHAVQLSDADTARLAATGTGVAHCPSSNARLGAGIAPVAALHAAGAPVGLGVDGAASNEHGHLARELSQALYVARLRDGAGAMTVRDVLRMATVGGATCLGRQAELGSLEPGKLADLAVWRLDGPGHAGIDDPIAALVLGPPAPLRLLLVNGATVVSGGELRTVTEDAVTAAATQAATRLAARAGGEEEGRCRSTGPPA